MYKTKEQAYRQLNFDLVVARADKLLEQRKELLPKGTRLQVEKQVLYGGIETEPPTSTQTGVVIGISTSCLGDEPLIETNGSIYLKEWFKITEEK